MKSLFPFLPLFLLFFLLSSCVKKQSEVLTQTELIEFCEAAMLLQYDQRKYGRDTQYTALRDTKLTYLKKYTNLQKISDELLSMATTHHKRTSTDSLKLTQTKIKNTVTTLHKFFVDQIDKIKTMSKNPQKEYEEYVGQLILKYRSLYDIVEDTVVKIKKQ